MAPFSIRYYRNEYQFFVFGLTRDLNPQPCEREASTLPMPPLLGHIMNHLMLG